MMFRISLSLQCYHEGKRKEEEENPSAGTDIAGHFQTPTAFWVGLLASSHSQKNPSYHLARESLTPLLHDFIITCCEEVDGVHIEHDLARYGFDFCMSYSSLLCCCVVEEEKRKKNKKTCHCTSLCGYSLKQRMLLFC